VQVSNSSISVIERTALNKLTVDSEFEHERLMCVRDEPTGLVAVFAFHSTRLGPAVGGMRYRRYGSLSEGMVDALRLSRAMTLKNAAARLAWGGGKLCVLEDGDVARRSSRLLRLAELLNDLDGAYIVGKDVGVTMADMDVLAERSPWVVGVPVERGGLGDPSPATATTVIGGMEAAAQQMYDTTDLSGMSAAIIGVGGVGASLADQLAERGVRLLLADTDTDRVGIVAARTNGEIVSTDTASTAEVDFLAPCATGEMFGADDVRGLRCRAIVGGANNPLVDDSVALLLHSAGIHYVPDFLSNSGGVIQNAVEFNRWGSMPWTSCSGRPTLELAPSWRGPGAMARRRWRSPARRRSPSLRPEPPPHRLRSARECGSLAEQLRARTSKTVCRRVSLGRGRPHLS